ncbi:MAG TPA: thiamine pyrophosphate-dependent enzyme, partial [Aquella sp.]|nr:thiamine pyrophosphate-dependent enzyme [Aquella sp.]
MDSIPGLIIAGNENSKFTTAENKLRIWGIQGYDGVAMVDKYTKLAIRVTDPTQIKKNLNQVYFESLNKRFGPSWIEIPLDIQAKKVAETESAPIEAPSKIKPDNIDASIDKIKDLIKSSKRPLLWLGHGVRLAGAQMLVKQLVEKFRIPVLVSWAGIDLLNDEDEFNFGSAGIYGLRSANFILQNCDLLITIGTRLSLMQVGYEITEFAREAKLVVNDIDSDEALKLGTRVTLPVVCDAKLFIEELLHKVQIDSSQVSNWISYCKEMRTKYPRVGFDNQDKDGYINSHKYLDKLQKYLEQNQMITTDMGTALISAHQVLIPKDGQRLFTSTGLGEMGYGLPAAIGASIATGKSKVVCLNCDG